eukprot:TRINITY_DN8299_c0_g1_i1.p1 TRINITY_DN8299_c0_g1~~TRINITY_DN8299_c0_g1_i1.p1  ORF type:complete len:319 (-),score=50.64 TRINITY_DN8299_c0_g1_i1:121-1077(-)
MPLSEQTMPDSPHSLNYYSDGYVTQDMDFQLSSVSSEHQPGASPSYVPSSPPASLQMSVPLRNAQLNVGHIRGYCRRTHFDSYYETEGKLYAITLYLGVDQSGQLVSIDLKRPSLRQRCSDLAYFRTVVTGTEEMFTSHRSLRPFWFEIQPALGPTTRTQQESIRFTEHLLNVRSRWLQEGFAPVTTPVVPIAYRAVATASPPGHGPSPPTRSPDQDTPDKRAMNNLHTLVNASVGQSAATLFMNDEGHICQILYGRPNGEQLQFLMEEEDRDLHFTMLRIGVNGTRVELTHPYDDLNPIQSEVVKHMENILNSACQH